MVEESGTLESQLEATKVSDAKTWNWGGAGNACHSMVKS